MKISFTKHAKEMLLQRKIEEAKVIKCINEPDKVLDPKDNKNIFIKDFGKNFLKVIVAIEGESYTVITLYWLAKKRLKK